MLQSDGQGAYLLVAAPIVQRVDDVSMLSCDVVVLSVRVSGGGVKELLARRARTYTDVFVCVCVCLYVCVCVCPSLKA
jgi:hypothetical protein